MEQHDVCSEEDMSVRSRSDRAIMGLILLGAVVYFVTRNLNYALIGALAGALIGYFWHQAVDVF
jgi:hypothetical protein